MTRRYRGEWRWIGIAGAFLIAIGVCVFVATDIYVERELRRQLAAGLPSADQDDLENAEATYIVQFAAFGSVLLGSAILGCSLMLASIWRADRPKDTNVTRSH